MVIVILNNMALVSPVTDLVGLKSFVVSPDTFLVILNKVLMSHSMASLNMVLMSCSMVLLNLNMLQMNKNF